MREIKESGLEKTAKVLVNGGLMHEAILPAIGDNALGIIGTSDYTPMHNSAINRQFVKDFKVAYGGDQMPTFIAAQAYDAITAAYKVLEAQHGTIDPDKTMAIWSGLKWESPRGPIEIDAQTHDITQNMYMRKVTKEGTKYQNVEFSTLPMVKADGT